jgi:hypothetical protein
MAFSSDDTFNTIAEHVQTALQADAKLGAAGALEISLWELETREDAAKFGDNQLPAVSIECLGLADTDETTVPDGLACYFPVSIWVTTSALERQRRRQIVKKYAARILRVMEQQEDPAKQLDNLPAALDWAESGSVVVVVDSVSVAEGQVEGSNLFRAVAEVVCLVKIDFTITGD